MRVIVITSRKGGSGKTTLAAHLARAVFTHPTMPIAMASGFGRRVMA